ncbi:hypothetical protein [Photobacterium sp. TY1-4]|nr:hypothetical protein [Photobacterium sp. TY1-4]UXI03137.1 hypothetical protein NH461_22110 [Photobacterium sp. TY1-4]
MSTSVQATIQMTLASGGIILGIAVMGSLPQLLIQLTYELGWNVTASI